MLDFPAMPASLEAATKELYAVFARHRRAANIEGCPCCVHESDKAALRDAPPQELAADELAHFAFKAMTTWGSSADYKHFFPRILEIAALEDAPHIGLELWLVQEKMQLAGWPSGWTHEEKLAVRQFVTAAAIALLDREAPGVDPTLRAVVWLDGDPAAVLGAWDTNASRTAVLQLARFITDNEASLMTERKLRWSSEVMSHPIDAWLLAPARLASLEAAFFASTDQAEARVISRAAEALSWCALKG